MKPGKNILLFVLMAAMLIWGTLAVSADSAWITVDSTSDLISFEEMTGGTWRTEMDENRSGGTERMSMRETSYAEFTFTGTEIRWLASKSNQRGIANVYINDELVAERVDLYSETPQYQEVIFETELDPGTYTLKIDPLNEASPEAMFSYVGIDALEYKPTLEGALELTSELAGISDFFEVIVRGKAYRDHQDKLPQEEIERATSDLITAYNQYHGVLIPQIQMSAEATSYQEGSDPAEHAIDGSTGTLWHTAWDLSDELPQSITLDLNGTYDVMKFSYLPRQDGNPNGNITEYKLYASTDGEEFTEITHGEWSEDSSEKILRFDPVEASYLKLEALEGVGGWASAALLNVYKTVQ